MIGNRSRLPRGRQCLDKDPEFFRSVHLVGEGLAREKEESKRRAEELWRSKVRGEAPAQCSVILLIEKLYDHRYSCFMYCYQI